MTIISQQTGQFSGYTLSDLRALVLRMLRVSDTTRYSPTNGIADYDWIDDALNRGQEDFVRKTLCLRTYALVELKANYRTYRLPWNFLDFMSAYFYHATDDGGYRELEVTTIETLNDDVSDWRTKTGDPASVYIDRIYGNNVMFGLYPIPDTDGETITFDSEYGTVNSWVCPLYTFASEYGVVIRMTDTDEFFLNTDSGVVAKVGAMEGNVWFEYYRLPEMLIDTTSVLGDMGTQYPEIPREYQKSLSYYAAWDLLKNNPEDSNEYKRSMIFKQDFKDETDSYISKRKKPISGQNVTARPTAQRSLASMDFYKGQF
jgi:hypothetical protein